MLFMELLIYLGILIILSACFLYSLLKRHQLGPALIKIGSPEQAWVRIIPLGLVVLIFVIVDPHHLFNLVFAAKLFLLIFLAFYYWALHSFYLAELRTKGIWTHLRVIHWQDIQTYYWSKIQKTFNFEYQKGSEIRTLSFWIKDQQKQTLEQILKSNLPEGERIQCPICFTLQRLDAVQCTYCGLNIKKPQVADGD